MEDTAMKWLAINLRKREIKGSIAFHFLVACLMLVCPQRANAEHSTSMPTDSSVLRVSADTIPDSVVIRRARALGMLDAQEVNALLQRYQRMEKVLARAADTSAWRYGQLRYVRNKERAYRQWMRLLPNQITLQYAGSIGLLNVGIGWRYGRNEHWETDFLVGFVPRYHSGVVHTTFTLKERYVPWHCHISSRWTLQPLTTGIFFNTISGSDFWHRLPDKYPKKYYGFSTKVRTNIFLGQRIRYRIPSRRRLLHSAVSAYYELSTCDLYIASKAVNKSYPWRETLSLALGLKWEM